MLRKIALGTIAVFAALAAGEPTMAKTYFVASLASGASGQGNGSAERPWPSVDAAFRSGKITGGDLVLLKDGNHGPLLIKDLSFKSAVTIRAQHFRKAHVEFIDVAGNTRNLHIQDLNVWPTKPGYPGTLIGTSPTASDLEFEGLDVRSGKDSVDYLKWNAGDWRSHAVDGAMIYSPRTTIRGSRFTAIRFGIAISANDGNVRGNRVSGFSADALRGNGDRNQFRGNYVENCVSIDDNHADGFQAFSQSRIVGLVLDRNRIFEWTANPNHPLRCYLQGVGLFDGFYDYLTIRNNVVSGRMGHGISVYGARHAKITHNTVVSADGQPGNVPWIGVFDHKNGTPSTDVIVANNLAMKYMGGTDPKNGIIYKGNAVIAYPAKVFRNVTNFDYTPTAKSGYVDRALPVYSTGLDVLRNARPYRAQPDIGAYEAGSSKASVAQRLADMASDAEEFGAQSADVQETVAVETPANDPAVAAQADDGAKFVSVP